VKDLGEKDRDKQEGVDVCGRIILERILGTWDGVLLITVTKERSVLRELYDETEVLIILNMFVFVNF
jgi:hypothetical protein